VNDDNRCTSILTKGALIKFLSEHVAKYPAVVDVPLYDKVCPTLAGSVVTAAETALAKDVFRLMDSKKLSGIAIVDEDTGELIGNTSASDVRMATFPGDGLSGLDLEQDIMSYISQVRRLRTMTTSYPVTRVPKSATIGHCIAVLASTGYHRVFVVDDERKPIGVLSVSDIVRYICK